MRGVRGQIGEASPGHAAADAASIWISIDLRWFSMPIREHANALQRVPNPELFPPIPLNSVHKTIDKFSAL
jgi:hypothetical protein